MTLPATPGPRVTVLLALYEGGPFLAAQLDSIAAQTGVDWRLIAGDDGSTDAGPAILRGFADAHPGRVALRDGPRQGAPANFRALLRTAPAGGLMAGGLTALADQDDVWLPGKLARAAEVLAGLPADRPAIYCSRVTVCDRDLVPVGLSRLPPRPPSFRHALVQNLVQGNTLVLNPAALRLVQAADLVAGPVVMHDWWIYQIVSGAGGRVVYDPEPWVMYRQHGGNVVGANDGAGARLASLGRMLRGEHRGWSRQNLAALERCAPLLAPDKRRVLAEFRRLVQCGPAARLSAMRRGGFYRQGGLSQAALWAAAALGRV